MARNTETEESQLGASNALRERHEKATAPAARKERGQVFTPPEICSFMASLASHLPKRIRVLDPGAGTGSLSAAFIDRIASLRSARQVDLHLYETDPLLEEPLRATAQRWERSLAKSGHSLKVTIHTEDFVLAHAHLGGTSPLFEAPQTDGFDVVIMNPPYFKVAGDSQHARILSSLVHGQPNIYALFMALAAELLNPKGELIAITPRSFCNGLYFRSFRRWMLDRVTLTRAHLFDSRRDAFRESGILQESVVTVFAKASRPPKTVRISGSQGRDDLAASRHVELSPDEVLDDTHGHSVLRLPSTDAEAALLAAVDTLPQRFSELGLRVSTGPVVSFRAKTFLVKAAHTKGTVPLIQVGNVRRFETSWPLPVNGKAQAFVDSPDTKKLTLNARNCVLMRRFSAKEEARRLTASCFFAEDCPTERVAFENHVNYLYHGERELTRDEVRGIAALFNSALMDRYFRCLSGNTQVNATELRALPMPSLEALSTLGASLPQSGLPKGGELERAVLKAIGASKQLQAELVETLA